MDTIVWTVITYESVSGDKPVDDFIRKQQPRGRSKIVHAVRLLRQYGNMLGIPHSKPLGRGLFELRTRGKEEFRILYFFEQKTIYLLHIFKKQTQQTPQKELNLAINRMGQLTAI